LLANPTPYAARSPARQRRPDALDRRCARG
jgi:hypothetical protein